MDVKVYTSPTCGYCHQVKRYLSERGVEFTERDISVDRAAAEDMIRQTGQTGVPVIVVDGEAVVGFDRPRLDQLLAGGEQVTEDEVIRILGTPPDQRTLALVGAIADGNAAAALTELDELLSSGVVLASVVAALADTYRNMMFFRAFAKDGDLAGTVKGVKAGFRAYPLARARYPPIASPAPPSATTRQSLSIAGSIANS